MLSKAIMISTIIVINIASLVNAQNHKNIKGWRQAEWGMSRDDLIEVFKGEISQVKSQTLKIKNFTISRYSFDVEFLMNENTNLLNGVHISYNLKDDSYKRMEFKSAFEFLEKSLIEKYGPPTYKKDDEEIDSEWNVFVGEKFDRSWNLPNTVIEIFYNFQDGFAPFRVQLGKSDDPSAGWGFLTLKYRKPDSKVLDKF